MLDFGVEFGTEQNHDDDIHIQIIMPMAALTTIMAS